jgi:hypothetical protein
MWEDCGAAAAGVHGLVEAGRRPEQSSELRKLMRAYR